MLVVDVEGEVSAASMVKDSKVYIEIAKFVQAYNTIIRNPNIFLSEIGEETIDSEKDILTWEQFVKIATTCDLGFNPVPTESQLVMYYSYAIQIGSISKEEKVIASVSDVAEAQKKYYNFIDDTTAKIESQYKKQHQIAENRFSEAVEVQNNIGKKKLKVSAMLCLMGLGVFLCGLGVIGLFFNVPIVTFFGFGNRYVGSVIFIVGGFCLFFFIDRVYMKLKYDYLQYKLDSEKVISRSDRTSRDELIMKDKLDKFREDLKVAKYELNDKDKTYDVQECIDKLKEKNKFYQNLLGDEDTKHRHGLFDELLKGNIDDLPIKDGRKSLGEKIADRLFGLSPEELENMSNVRKDPFINSDSPFDKSLFELDLMGKRGHRHGHDEHDHRYKDDILGTAIDKYEEGLSDVTKAQRQRQSQEEVMNQQRQAEEVSKNAQGMGSASFSYDDFSEKLRNSSSVSPNFSVGENAKKLDEIMETTKDFIAQSESYNQAELDEAFETIFKDSSIDEMSDNKSTDFENLQETVESAESEIKDMIQDELIEQDAFDDFKAYLGSSDDGLLNDMIDYNPEEVKKKVEEIKKAQNQNSQGGMEL